MKLEHMKQEFPKMPDGIRTMVERTVAEQLGTPQKKRRVRKFSSKKAVLIGLAATLTLGTSVFAGVSIYRLCTEPLGAYGVKTGFGPDTAAQSGETTKPAANEAPAAVQNVTVQTNYIPDGMVEAPDEPGKLYREATPYQGGISMVATVMDTDTTKESLQMTDTGVTFREELKIAGHEAVYIEKGQDTKKFYVVYPEVWYVLEAFVGNDVTKEEALKVIEHTELVPTGEEVRIEDAYTWSDMVAGRNETEYEESWESGLTASAIEMQNMHRIGDEFSVHTVDSEVNPIDCITAKVTDVQIADDLKLLGDSELPSHWTSVADADGRLLPNEIQYIKSGDGIDTLDEVQKTETVAQKLVYVTVEYTNHGDSVLENVLFYSDFPRIVENGDTYAMYERQNQYPELDCDQILCSSVGSYAEGAFFDLHGGERNNNYIPSMQPQETVTLHLAQIVNEDELPYLFLCLNTSGGSYSFTESALEEGYVDIRQ